MKIRYEEGECSIEYDQDKGRITVTQKPTSPGSSGKAWEFLIFTAEEFIAVQRGLIQAIASYKEV